MFPLEKISHPFHKVKSDTDFSAYRQAIKSGRILLDEFHNSAHHIDPIGDLMFSMDGIICPI